MQMPKRIVRKKEAWLRLGCGHSKFHEAYVLRDPADPFVPGTEIPRLKPIPLGSRNIGFLDHEIDELIDALAELRNAPEVGTRTTQVFLTDARPRELGQRRELLERGKRLRAQAIGDPDPETKSEIEEIERALRVLDRPQK
jgi:predicted DNA-binding transcriptional regulator AlpA